MHCRLQRTPAAKKGKEVEHVEPQTNAKVPPFDSFRRKCLLAAYHQNTKAVPCTPAPYRDVEAEAFNLHLITPVSFCEYPNQGRRVL